jgi:uncharacterized protein YegP (UPF0339 family)
MMAIRRRKCRYEIFEGKDHRWYWRLIAANDRIVGQSEGYLNRSNALREAKDNKDAARSARFVLIPTPKEEPAA